MPTYPGSQRCFVCPNPFPVHTRAQCPYGPPISFYLAKGGSASRSTASSVPLPSPCIDFLMENSPSPQTKPARKPFQKPGLSMPPPGSETSPSEPARVSFGHQFPAHSPELGRRTNEESADDEPMDDEPTMDDKPIDSELPKDELLIADRQRQSYSFIPKPSPEKITKKLVEIRDDYYQVLAIERTATNSQIRKAYHTLSLVHHPDKNPGDHLASERFKIIGTAYETLTDPQKRAVYDLTYRRREPQRHVPRPTSRPSPHSTPRPAARPAPQPPRSGPQRSANPRPFAKMRKRRAGMKAPSSNFKA